MRTNLAKKIVQTALLAALSVALCFAAPSASAFVVLAGWEVTGLANSGPSPFTPATSAAGLTIVGLTRGSGVNSTTTANVWGGNNWTNAGIVDSESQAITGNKFVTCSVAPAATYTVSFNAVDKFFYTHSGTGPGNGDFQYSLDGVNFTSVQTISYGASGSLTIDLSGISALQNVGSGTNVTFRIVNWGSSTTAGTWYISGNAAGNDFELLGTVTQIPSGTAPTNLVVTPSAVTTNANATVNFNVSAGGDLPSYFWYQEASGQTNVFSPANLVSTTGATLSLPAVTALNSGNYQVVLTNSAGAATSSVVTLNVNDPGILTQPGNMTNVFGDLDFFNATVVSSQPGQMLWYYNGNVVSNIVTSPITNATTIFTINDFNATNSSGYYLVVSNQYGMVTSAVATATIFRTPTNEIARWDFNDTSGYTATNPLPSIGSGFAYAVTNPAVTNFIFAPGALFDPAQLISVNNGWELDGFPAGISNKTAGFEFHTSTASNNNVVITWSERHSATASKYMRLQYTTNGTDWVDGDVVTFNAVAYQFYSSDLSGKPGVANNTNFAFRVVAEFESTAINDANSAYVGTTGGFGATGTIRVDLMTVWGNSVSGSPSPIPLAIRFDGTNAIMSWTDPSSAFSLQSATQVVGGYTTISGATSPYTNVTTDAQKFFRLKSN